MATGFGLDPGLGDALGIFIANQIEEGNITGGQAIVLGIGAMALSKGVGAKPSFWISKSTYQELKGISPKLLD